VSRLRQLPTHPRGRAGGGGMNDTQTAYYCREFGATVHSTDLAALLSERGYTVTARREVRG